MKKTMNNLFMTAAITVGLAGTASADMPAVVIDPTATYKPTQIVNGDFAKFPWTDFTYGGTRHTDGFFQTVNNVTVHPNGVDGGWNTTETSIWSETGSLYDNFYDADPSTASGFPKRSDGTRTLGYVNAHSASANCGSAALYGKGQNIFIEMNASHADTLYQDLTTFDNDVMRWTLKHAARTDADAYQPISVLIGAPLMSGGSIVYPSGTDAKIESSTLGTYNYAGCSGTYAYANVSELVNLRLNKSTQSGAWYTASGVYVIPEKQSVTRFAFRSDADTANAGNFLDDITFSTLIGNLKAAANHDGSVTVKGYWGDSDATKKLMVKIGSATPLELDMADVCNTNFTTTIPVTMIVGATQLEVYHSDYESAKRTIKIYDHWHCICGDGACTAEGHVHEVVGWEKWTATDSLPTTAGNWYLANDVTLSSTYQPATGVNLCLNGHVIKNGGSCDKLVNISGAVFTLTDCTDTPHYFNKVNAGYRTDVWVYSLTMTPSASSICVKGGCITGGYGWSGSPTHSPCMNVVSGGTFNFYRGNLVGNCSEQASAGMLVDSGATLNMYAGNIEGNYSYWCFCNLNGTANIYGGSFRNNGNGPGGIACNGITTIHDIEVSGNVSYDGVAGLYAAGTFTMLGGKVVGNRSTKVNGGLCIATANATIGGNVCITGNYCNATRTGFEYSGGTINNLYLQADKTVAVSTTTPLAADAQIGVTTQTAPTGTTKVPVTGANTSDYSGCFTSDNSDYYVLNDANTVKLAMIPRFTITFCPTAAGDETCGGKPFTMTNVVYTYGGSVSQTPIVVKPDCVQLGWSKTATATKPEYTTEQLSTITTEFGSNIFLYPVWGVPLGVPVYVAMDECSTLPDDGRVYTFELKALDSYTLMPSTNRVEIGVPAGRGESAAIGYGVNDVANPWRMVYPKGDYYYHLSQVTNGVHMCEKLDEGFWEVAVSVDPNAIPRYTISSAVYYGKVAEIDENSFHIVKANANVAAKVTVEGSKTKVALGGNQVVSGDAFNTAIMKGKFEIDFTRNFRVIGSFTPPPAATPDGTCVGFMPNTQTLSASDLVGGGNLGYIGNVKFAKSIVLDFDPYDNGSTYGDPGYRHFTLTETKDNGWPNYANAQHKNVSSSWPTTPCQYLIENDLSTKKLKFKVTLPSSSVLEYSYDNPTNLFKTSTAYFFMSGVVRYGAAGSWGLGSVGSTAPSLTMYFDSFNYIGQRDGYASTTNLFVNRQEAKVTYNAWGGQFEDGQENWESFAKDAKMSNPLEVPTRLGEYEFIGWYNSWTNGALLVTEGLLDPIADCVRYGKWLSPSTPSGEGEKTFGFDVVGDGAVLYGATNKLRIVDLAIPEFTKNGPDGIPYVIIKESAFSYQNYDRKREQELRAAGVPKAFAISNRLTSVVVSTYVTNIQAFAFSGCEGLTNVVFTRTRDYRTGEIATLRIGNGAFKDSTVRSVVFPADSSVILDYGAFADAEYIEDITFLGDIALEARYPFAGVGTRHYAKTGNPVKIHLSAKLAADSAFVAALTNGMSAARIVLDKEIEGKLTDMVADVASDPMVFTFRPDASSPWRTVTRDTVYLFYAKNLGEFAVGTGKVIHPDASATGLTGPDAGGYYRAEFTKPAGNAGFFKLCLGAAQ